MFVCLFVSQGFYIVLKVRWNILSWKIPSTPPLFYATTTAPSMEIIKCC